MGYANEVGEALENYLPDWGLPASYCVAATYVIFDTFDKGQKAFDAAPRNERLEESLKASTETFIWQILASLFWPGGVIRLTVNMLDLLIPGDNEYLSTTLGILLIPVIVRPIDEFVDEIMEDSISKVLRGDVTMALWNLMGSVSVPPILYIFATLIKKLKT
jgi:mitochondrial fission process protein 1